MTSAYIRASVAKRMANGDEMRSTTPTHSAPRPAARRAASHMSGSDATDVTPPNARMTPSESPKTRIQTWSSR